MVLIDINAHYKFIGRLIKKLLLSGFIILIAAFWKNTCHSQIKLPDMPLKEGLIYYQFKDTLNNKKCLKSYFKVNYGEINSKIAAKIHEEEKLRYQYVKKTDSKLILMHIPTKIYNSSLKMQTCADTFNKGNLYILFPEKLNYFDFTPLGILINAGKKRIEYMAVKSNIEVVFFSNNIFEVRYKSFTIETKFRNGEESTIELSDLYQISKKQENLKKEDIVLFEEIDFWVKRSHEIMNKSLEQVFKYDD